MFMLQIVLSINISDIVFILKKQYHFILETKFRSGFVDTGMDGVGDGGPGREGNCGL